jgi:quinol monooxygenase YgiN
MNSSTQDKVEGAAKDIAVRVKEVTGKAVGKTRLQTTKELLGIARLKIHPGKLEEFRNLQAKCMESVRTKDTGTLQYECFFSSDYTECLVVERYRDSEALLEHTANLGETSAAIFKTCSAAGEICGTPSPELMKALEGSPVRIFSPYLSMQRNVAQVENFSGSSPVEHRSFVEIQIRKPENQP